MIPRFNFRPPKFQNFPQGACPQTPLDIACECARNQRSGNQSLKSVEQPMIAISRFMSSKTKTV